jgi:Mn-dependent DtxR family transcriptional regulator
MLLLSVVIGIFTAVAGLLGSYHLNFASGASMVVFATIVFLLALIFSPKQGLLVKSFRRRDSASRHLGQDILKVIYKNCFDINKKKICDNFSADEIAMWIGTTTKRVMSQARKLRQTGLIKLSGNDIELTSDGEKYALRVIRSHRLWESYLQNEKILDRKNIHSEAEEYEHILTDEILDEIELELGHPRLDPHGSPIPEVKEFKGKNH